MCMCLSMVYNGKQPVSDMASGSHLGLTSSLIQSCFEKSAGDHGMQSIKPQTTLCGIT